jgi:hypothetical protein
MLTIKELLQKVSVLIESNKYKKIRGGLKEGAYSRCYLGLVAQTLVDEGYYEWRTDYPSNLHTYYLEPTVKGQTAGFKRHSAISFVPIKNFPTSVYSPTHRLIVEVWSLNDNHSMSFADIHERVLAASGHQAEAVIEPGMPSRFKR